MKTAIPKPEGGREEGRRSSAEVTPVTDDEMGSTRQSLQYV